MMTTNETQPQPYDDPFSRFDECALAVETLEKFLEQREQESRA